MLVMFTARGSLDCPQSRTVELDGVYLVSCADSSTVPCQQRVDPIAEPWGLPDRTDGPRRHASSPHLGSLGSTVGTPEFERVRALL